jgi:hypothetical protein
VYAVTIVLLLLVLPASSLGIDLYLHPHQAVLDLAGRWWTFWGVGIRLFLAGVRQVVQPAYTAEAIFGLEDPGALPIVREVGFGNLAFGTLGILSLLRVEWLVPAAIAGGIYYGLAGVGHIPRKNKNSKEWTALVSDLGVFLILAAFLAGRLS